ncbi:prepilin-type N-terminal cleavage/methylation domain-containing protein [Rhodocyclus tenuis]|uniref:prepilin-type N-terminal cleavage/methylation domain-containing protein n=1 Tax=Rhodocyclus tenuis TaxID=1066 RepID=UPI00190371FF|nr:general secretion pathway protein GspG [Rhodocyclus tenuis]
MKQRRHASGFTLIELVVTVAIVSVLATIALPLAETTIQRSKEAELRSALRQIREGIDAYKRAGEEGRIQLRADASGYPPRLEVLENGVEDIRRPDLAKIYFLRRLPRDPFNADPSLPAAETWGKRSYASAPDNPAPGDDVFDVHSLAEGRGLNGIAYRQW